MLRTTSTDGMCACLAQQIPRHPANGRPMLYSNPQLVSEAHVTEPLPCGVLGLTGVLPAERLDAYEREQWGRNTQDCVCDAVRRSRYYLMPM